MRLLGTACQNIKLYQYLTYKSPNIIHMHWHLLFNPIGTWYKYQMGDQGLETQIAWILFLPLATLWNNLTWFITAIGSFPLISSHFFNMLWPVSQFNPYPSLLWMVFWIISISSCKYIILQRATSPWFPDGFASPTWKGPQPDPKTLSQKGTQKRAEKLKGEMQPLENIDKAVPSCKSSII